MTEREIFTNALVRDNPAERAAFLDEACVGDDALRLRVESLLVEYQRLGSFMDVPSTLDQPRPERPGTQIGPYKLLQQIGEGGMGVVYMAEQTEPVKRKVALKLIKPGMDSRQVIARFEAERQALSMMDHVNIARVLDAGTIGFSIDDFRFSIDGKQPEQSSIENQKSKIENSGRPYFVMELIHGVPITKYCDDNRLTPRERLELFVPVCQAIQHAHQKGIIHRDIKPSNVMVTLYDGKPVPKVIDFGVAKATEQNLTERTLFTQYGTMVGTLEYMSPEQAEMSALGVDTRSDIYSLGVLLYELLTGSTPLSHKRMKEAAYAEILRLIKEEEPPRPSTRLSESGEALASISAHRHMEPAKLSKLMRGELDWIVMKTLEKDRNRRYETANGFAADVQRYLNDEPVQACPPSAAYRFRKFARRNKGSLATATLLAVMLLLGVVLLAVNNVRIKAEQARTTEQKTRAETALADAKENLELADENLGLALEALDEVYMKEIEKRVLEKRQLSPADREFLQKGLRFYEQFGKRNSTHAGLQGATAKANRRAGYLRLELAQWQDAEAHFRKAIPLLEKLVAESPTEVEYRRELASSRHGRSIGLRLIGRLQDAEAVGRQAIALWQELATEFANEPDFRLQLGHALWQLREVYSITGRHREAEEVIRKALKLFEQLNVEFPKEFFYRQEMAFSQRHLALGLRVQGQPEEAAQSMQQAVFLYAGLATDAPNNAFLRHELALCYATLGDYLKDSRRTQDAEDAYRSAVNLLETLAQERAQDANYRRQLPWGLRQQAAFLRESNRLPEAEQAYRRALAVYTDMAAGDSAEPDYWRQMGAVSHELAQVLQSAGRASEAHEAYKQAMHANREALARFQKRVAESPSPTHRWQVADCLGWLGEHLRLTGQPQEAVTVWRSCLPDLEKLVKEVDDPQYGWLLASRHSGLGDLLKEMGRNREAEQAYRDSLVVWNKLVANHNLPEHRSSLVATQGHLVANLTQQGRHTEAAELALGLDDPQTQNVIAWKIVASPAPDPQAVKLAVGLAQKAVARAPNAAHIVNTLGTAYYRAGDWKAAIDTLKRGDSMDGGRMFSFNAFFIAMAHWQQGEKDQARNWYDHAITWMDKNKQQNEELQRFREEAAELLGVTVSKK